MKTKHKLGHVVQSILHPSSLILVVTAALLTISAAPPRPSAAPASKPAKPASAAAPKTAAPDTAAKSDDRQSFVLRRPGEITFTTGAVIEGKIEKPQVMIILPKEKIQADSIIFDQSFRAQMLEPLDIQSVRATEME